MSIETVASTDLTILTFNDVYDFNPDHEGLGGLSELQTIIEKEKQKNKNVITTLNGDFLEVLSISSIYKGSHAIDVLNAMSSKKNFFFTQLSS
jgi:2',3'-cyclic-nucleotide 2'-phosphodiesterase (5'-nucleotidase family)